VNATPLHFVLDPLPGCDPEIGRALAALAETRERTLEAVADLPPEWLDAPPPVGVNTIGSLLYHIAQTESGNLYDNLLGQPPPPDVVARIPGHRDAQGVLLTRPGERLDSYLDRLRFVREKLVAAYQPLTLAEYQAARPRSGVVPHYEISGAWILHHLMQHEAEHRGHIHLIRESLTRPAPERREETPRP
jgi:uncharacterized damage-inducible protein DinB